MTLSNIGVDKVIKRDGRLENFDPERIRNAIMKAMLSVGRHDPIVLDNVVKFILDVIRDKYAGKKIPHVEEIQDIVEFALVKFDQYEVAKAYILYRKEREKIREEKKKLLEKDYVDEVDKSLSLNAIRLLASRYLLRDDKGKLIEDPKRMFIRVASLIVIPDILYDERVYDKEGKQPIHDEEYFNPDEWDGKIGLRNEKGELAFTWNKYHLERLKNLYDRLNKEGKMKISWKKLLEMLINGEFDNHYSDFKSYYELMVSKKFLPNSPTLFNAGTRLGQLSACFVLDIDDSLESIMSAARDAAIIFKSGGGVGINYSKLRPEGDIVKSTGGTASGPVSFMRIIDVVTDVVKQGGKRRGANMGIMEIWHPDIEKFITCKSDGQSFQNFNISVMITDDFWKHYENGEPYPLINPRTKKVWKTIDPKTLLNLIAENAWRTGDPGVLFMDNINRRNVLLKTKGPIRTTNPCVTGDTLVITNKGLVEARDLREGMYVWTLEGWRKIEKVYDNGIQDIYEIELVNGLRLRLTRDHKLLTTDGWKKLEDIREGEKIRIVLEAPESYGDALLLNENFAEELGYRIGTKNLGYNQKEIIEEQRPFETKLIMKTTSSVHLANHSIITPRNQASIIKESSHELMTITLDRLSEILIPSVIMRSEKHVQAAFLKGLFKAIGKIYRQDKGITIEFSSYTKELLEKVQIMLMTFGIYSVLKEGSNENNGLNNSFGRNSQNYRLLITGRDAKLFIYKILLQIRNKSNRKLLQLEKHPVNKLFVEINKIRYVGKERVYDIKASPTYTWVTNGIYSFDCGEEPLYPYGSCNLGSINVYAFIKRGKDGKAEFDWEEYRKSIRIALRFLDNVIDVNKFPLKEIEKETLENRKVGLGIMGLADALYALDITYNSEEGFEFMRVLVENLTYYAMLESTELSEKRGPFPLFYESGYIEGEMPVEGYYRKDLWTLDWESLVKRIKEKGIRNYEVTTIAPTGSISMIFDVSSGIEPQFALVYEKRVSVGTFYYVDIEFERKLRERSLYREDILKKIAENGGSLQGLNDIPVDLKKIFVVAYDIPWWDHLRAQYELQLWITTSISKTINMPSWVTVEDVLKAYLFAYRLGLKGVTVFREGSKGEAVLVTPSQRKGHYVLDIKNRTLEIMKELGIEPPSYSSHLQIIEKTRASLRLENNGLMYPRKTLSKKITVCPECGSKNIIYKEGCITCMDCGWSACPIS